MGPEDSLEITPGGKVYIVPLGGNPEEIMNRGPRELKLTTDGDIDWGSDGGLDGGLRGWPGGAPAHEGLGSWSMELELSPGSSDGFMAALMGRSVSEYRDLKRWVREARWLERLTGLDWSLT